jgi:hypothetical protein
VSNHRKFHPLQIVLFSIFMIAVFVYLLNNKTAFPTPVLLPGEYVQDVSGDIAAGLWSVPLVYDWDDDGRADLLLGQRYDAEKERHGYIRFYRNIGTDSGPAFNGFTLIESGGECCLDVPVDG